MFKILFDEVTLGITVESLQKLRNELCDRINDVIEIHQINTSELTCGFLIIDHTTKEAVFSGDGFRTDYGGEGGAGMKSAEILLRLFGFDLVDDVGTINPIVVDRVNRAYYQALQEYLTEKETAGQLIFRNRELRDYKPGYIRFLP